MRRPGSASQLADVLLGQAGFEQRRRDAMLARGLLSGTVVALVVDIHAISDGVEAVLRAERSITVNSSSLQWKQRDASFGGTRAAPSRRSE